MRLAEMSLDQSRTAQMLIVPEIEKIISDKGTAKLFDDLHTSGNDKKSVKLRIDASKKLVAKLIDEHYEPTCIILAAMNDTTVQEIKKGNRADANKYILDMLLDGDLSSFFISSDRLAQDALSDS